MTKIKAFVQVSHANADGRAMKLASRTYLSQLTENGCDATELQTVKRMCLWNTDALVGTKYIFRMTVKVVHICSFKIVLLWEHVHVKYEVSFLMVLSPFAANVANPIRHSRLPMSRIGNLDPLPNPV